MTSICIECGIGCGKIQCTLCGGYICEDHRDTFDTNLPYFSGIYVCNRCHKVCEILRKVRPTHDLHISATKHYWNGVTNKEIKEIININNTSTKVPDKYTTKKKEASKHKSL